jgi:hypothetical protein
MLLPQLIRLAASRAAWTAGSSRPTKIPMIAMTTSNSTSVKPVLTKLFFMGLSVGLKETKKKPTKYSC